MFFNSDNPLVVQSNGTIVIETGHKKFPIIQPMLSQMATLEKATTTTYTYKLSAYSIWSAHSQGIQVIEIINFLSEYCKYPLSQLFVENLEQLYQRSTSVFMEKKSGQCLLRFTDKFVEQTLLKDDELRGLLNKSVNDWFFSEEDRGEIKSLCVKYGYFIIDKIGYEKGQRLKSKLKAQTNLRPYQEEAVKQFFRGGNGVVVMPCGSGKTIVGLGVMEKIQEEVLIITSSQTSMKQWQREIIEKTSVQEDLIGLYSSTSKKVRPITIASYQMMIYKDQSSKEFVHLPLFEMRNWGLVIYDEVHLLPAPVFRATSFIQGKRRLGLTATLVREDGKEEEVYSLIGPKQYEVSWKGLENNGWIAKTLCKEIRVDFAEAKLTEYITSNQQQQFKIAAINPTKLNAIVKILAKHKQQPTLIIGQYLDQLREVSTQLQLPMITGKTPQSERERLYQLFRKGEIDVLVVSKVANFAVDLPDAQVAIQISGAFGSRQEEAQRVGRLLRPKKNGDDAYFYTIVTRNTKEEQFSHHRQLFMLEQGYQYEVEEWLS